MIRTARLAAAALLVTIVAALAAAQRYEPPAHTEAPPLVGKANPDELAILAERGTAIERDRSPADALAEHRRLDRALATLTPNRRGVVEAYVVAMALDSDPVFGREAREAGRVLTRRYAAAGRSVVLAGSDGTGASTLPMGSPAHLAVVLARIAELMGKEDVLILYTTSHGAPFGIVYSDGDQGFGAISPGKLSSLLAQLGIANRLLMISACYSGIFVPLLASDTSVVLTASSADRTSFGCQADNDWTFVGDALINHALRQPHRLSAAATEARTLIGNWERRSDLTPSQPQISVGRRAGKWLAVLERDLPSLTPQVGRPATMALAAP